jgi:hypothetical protein
MKPAAILLFLLLTGITPGWAVETGLETIRISPVEVPEDIETVLEKLESRTGFVSANWDTSLGAFMVSVEDSIRFQPHELRQELEGIGLDVETLLLEFKGARGEIRKAAIGSRGYMVSEANDMDFPVLSGTNSRRLWYFLGRTPHGGDVPLNMSCVVHFGAPDSNGVFAPDTVDVVRFRVTAWEAEKLGGN